MELKALELMKMELKDIVSWTWRDILSWASEELFLKFAEIRCNLGVPC